jgi:hypothetical protein
MLENSSMKIIQIINFAGVFLKICLLKKDTKMMANSVGMNRKRKSLKKNLKNKKRKEKDKIWKG